MPGLISCQVPKTWPLTGQHQSTAATTTPKRRSVPGKTTKLLGASSALVVRACSATLNAGYSREICHTYHLLLGNSQDEEDKYLEIYKNQNNLYLLFIYYFGKTLFSYFCKDYFMAFNNSQEAEKYVMGITGFIPTPQHNFYFSLSLIASSLLVLP